MALKPRLIEAVKQYPNLYDIKHEDYKDLAFKDKCWLEIAQQLNENCELLKHEWKILRDSYRQATKRRRVAKVGCKPRRWVFEKKMSFLRPFVTTRRFADRSGPAPDEEMVSEISASSESACEEPMPVTEPMQDPILLDDDHEDTEKANDIFWNESEPTTSAPNIVKKEKQFTQKEYSKNRSKGYTLKRGKSSTQKEDKTYPEKERGSFIPKADTRFTDLSESEDDMELFFKSLLCTAKKLPKNYQIKLKIKLLEAVSQVEEEFYNWTEHKVVGGP